MFFFGSNRRLSKSIEGQLQSPNGEKAGGVEGAAQSKEKLLTQVNQLQSEMSRLQMQLASMQYEKTKEELSTQRSHQTFSTKGTTPPATANSIPRFVCIECCGATTTLRMTFLTICLSLLCVVQS